MTLGMPPGARNRGLPASHVGDAKRLAVERVEERPPAYYQAEAADLRRHPERVVRWNAVEAFGDFLEPLPRFFPDLLRRTPQAGLDHDHAMGQDSSPLNPPRQRSAAPTRLFKP